MEKKDLEVHAFPKDSLALIKFANSIGNKFKFINIYSKN